VGSRDAPQGLGSRSVIPATGQPCPGGQAVVGEQRSSRLGLQRPRGGGPKTALGKAAAGTSGGAGANDKIVASSPSHPIVRSLSFALTELDKSSQS
jgi:hypothetical protein